MTKRMILVWVLALLVVGLVGVKVAYAASTIPVPALTNCPWQVDENWLPPPPNANQGPVPAPVIFCAMVIQTQ